MPDFTPINQLDFFEMKEAFKTYLKAQDRFKDFNFEGSNINVLLDVLAYNTFYNQYYNNVVISEMFLDSAQLRNSVVSHAKELNYIPLSKRSAYAVISLTILAEQEANTFVIPKYTKFNARCGDRTYTFLTDQVHIATRVSGNTFSLSNINVYEGRIVQEKIDINDTVLSNNSIDTTSIEVLVNGETYRQKSDIFGVTSSDKVFYIQPEEDGKYSIQFGLNTFGVQPLNTDTIDVKYRITNGAEANGVTSISIANKNLNDALSIATNIVTFSEGGRDEESLASIKMFAPKALQVQERAVTKSDYEILLRNRFPNIKSISVFGGDEIDPPQYGRVIISVDVSNGEGATASELASFREFLKDKTPLTIEPIFVPAQFLYVSGDITIRYNSNKTDKLPAQISALASQAIIDYSVNNIEGYNSRFPTSKILKIVDDIDEAITSSTIDTRAIIEYRPNLGFSNNPTFDFNNQIKQSYAFNETTGFGNYDPSIYSSNFTVSGNSVYFIDDGLGNINLIKSDSNENSVFRRTVGTVNYSTGIVNLSNLTISEYEGENIKIYARTVNRDINSSKDRILIVREEDINITVVAI